MSGFSWKGFRGKDNATPHSATGSASVSSAATLAALPPGESVGAGATGNGAAGAGVEGSTSSGSGRIDKTIPPIPRTMASADSLPSGATAVPSSTTASSSHIASWEDFPHLHQSPGLQLQDQHQLLQQNGRNQQQLSNAGIPVGSPLSKSIVAQAHVQDAATGYSHPLSQPRRDSSTHPASHVSQALPAHARIMEWSSRSTAAGSGAKDGSIPVVAGGTTSTGASSGAANGGLGGYELHRAWTGMELHGGRGLTSAFSLLGLDNFGNTCYANSVLQSLYACRPFREALLACDPNGFDPSSAAMETKETAHVEEIAAAASDEKIPEQDSNRTQETVLNGEQSPRALTAQLAESSLSESISPGGPGLMVQTANLGPSIPNLRPSDPNSAHTRSLAPSGYATPVSNAAANMNGSMTLGQAGHSFGTVPGSGPEFDLRHQLAAASAAREPLTASSFSAGSMPPSQTGSPRMDQVEASPEKDSTTSVAGLEQASLARLRAISTHKRGLSHDSNGMPAVPPSPTSSIGSSTGRAWANRRRNKKDKKEEEKQKKDEASAAAAAAAAEKENAALKEKKEQVVAVPETLFEALRALFERMIEAQHGKSFHDQSTEGAASTDAIPTSAASSTTGNTSFLSKQSPAAVSGGKVLPYGRGGSAAASAASAAATTTASAGSSNAISTGGGTYTAGYSMLHSVPGSTRGITPVRGATGVADSQAVKRFLAVLKKENVLFDSTMHQDAHEMLNFVLNKLGEELVDLDRKSKRARPNGVAAGTTNKSQMTAVERRQGVSPTFVDSDGKTAIHRLFEGVLTNETKCLTCETVRRRSTVRKAWMMLTSRSPPGHISRRVFSGSIDRY